MSSNNGQKLIVFGLTFAQHDSRKMQQVLRHYNRLPGSPGSRALLFVELQKLAKELVANEASQKSQQQAQQLTDWMRNGGSFPLGEVPAPVNAAAFHHGAHLQGYRPTDHSQPEWNGNLGPGHFLDNAVAEDDGPEDDDHEDGSPQENDTSMDGAELFGMDFPWTGAHA
ncbi:hypothetical protein M406DRAFT_346347 [Cryphonectria parasitica EP155]|uniref:Uncharacterized protein n=1 Tax=Cryphonectria parasitica (strain ATCC 38755 / EP155) TaxID=660469 RepID=A0A9P4Y4R8_CRYP1|nr:uncharacterized protein M406DRAFT_346347 [Cryphonectria parasitica EP155]KAF3766465.1 hypothetical protein M406DRAFT_346347 [Cryphonectria parasitica EP155]